MVMPAIDVQPSLLRPPCADMPVVALMTAPPTSCGTLVVMPGESTPSAQMLRPAGIVSMISRSTIHRRAVFCTSTVGASPTTVTVSSTAPTRRSAFTVAVKLPVSSTPSRRSVLNPARVKVTV